MEKDFEEWSAKKSELNKKQKMPYFYEREIWFCYIGINIGFEIDGGSYNFLRPVLIIKKINQVTFIGIPLTRTARYGTYHFSITDDLGNSFAMLSQVRMMDGKRLCYRYRVISQVLFDEINKKFLDLF